MGKTRIVVGISGASGAPVAVEVLRFLRDAPSVETHLVVTRGAEMTIGYETALTLDEIRALADVPHNIDDIGASIASGSFRTSGMVIVPCSMKTLAGIAGGYSDNLLLRAADVTLKERRRLILAVRETPLGGVHLRNMAELDRLGAVVAPLVLTYYNRPRTAGDMTRQMAGRLLDLAGFEAAGCCRWGEQPHDLP